MNNSLILQPEYQEKIRNKINEMSEVKKNANTNTFWEITKGSIRN